MYSVVLTLHSILRWLVLLAALLSIIRAINGLSFKRGWTGMDKRVGTWFTGMLDLQVLLGIILYFFLSPITSSVLQNFSGAMNSPAARFFGIEHVVMMVIAVAVAHMGSVFIRRAPTPAQAHRRTIIWYGLALLIVLAAIPWPFLNGIGRPLLRFGA